MRSNARPRRIKRKKRDIIGAKKTALLRGNGMVEKSLDKLFGA